MIRTYLERVLKMLVPRCAFQTAKWSVQVGVMIFQTHSGTAGVFMEPLFTLADLKMGQSGIITYILLTGPMQRRLLDLGMINGTSVKCLYKSPSGDPIAFSLRHTTIALRKEDAANILIREIEY